MSWKSRLQSAAVSIGIAAAAANIQPVETKPTETVPQTPDKATTLTLRRDTPNWMEGHDGADRRLAYPFGLERSNRSLFRDQIIENTKVPTPTVTPEPQQVETNESNQDQATEIRENKFPLPAETTVVTQTAPDEKSLLMQANRQILKESLNKRFREQRTLRETQITTPTLPLQISEKKRIQFARDLSLMPTVLEKGYGAETPWLSNELLLSDENSELMPTAEELQYSVEKFKPKTKKDFFSNITAEQIVDIARKYKLNDGKVIDPVAVLGFIHAENQILTDKNQFDKKNHNPGALRNSNLASGFSYNSNGKFARFSDLPTGVEAIFENFISHDSYIQSGITDIGTLKESYSPWGDGNNNPRLSALNVLKSTYHIREGILEKRLENTTDPVLRQKYEEQINLIQIGIKQANKQMLAYMNIKGKIPKIKKR